MPVRQVGEPLAIPRAIEVKETPIQTVDESAYIYLTDSTETNKVRVPTRVGEGATVLAAFTSRPLSETEQKEYRNAHKLPDGVPVAPESVRCLVKSTSGNKFEILDVLSPSDGIYEAAIPALTDVGGWFYTFVGSGGYEATATRAIEVR